MFHEFLLILYIICFVLSSQTKAVGIVRCRSRPIAKDLDGPDLLCDDIHYGELVTIVVDQVVDASIIVSTTINLQRA